MLLGVDGPVVRAIDRTVSFRVIKQAGYFPLSFPYITPVFSSSLTLVEAQNSFNITSKYVIFSNVVPSLKRLNVYRVCLERPDTNW